MSTRMFGETIEGLAMQGQPIKAGVFDENQVRAAAGITLDDKYYLVLDDTKRFVGKLERR